MPFIKYQNKKVHFRLEGSGSKNIIFLHGFLGDLSIWDRYISDLQDDFKILRIDLAGHGLSDNLGETHTMELLSKPVTQVMSHVGMSSAHFVGHSMGGYVAMSIAENSNERMESLCLFNSTAAEDSEQKKKDRIRTIRLINLSPELFVQEAINNLFTKANLKKYPSEVKVLQEKGLKMALIGAAPALRGMAERKTMVSLLQKSNFPVLFLSGRHDNIIPIESIIEQVSETRSSLTILEETNHMGFIEEYEYTLEQLQRFWKKKPI